MQHIEIRVSGNTFHSRFKSVAVKFFYNCFFPKMLHLETSIDLARGKQMKKLHRQTAPALRLDILHHLLISLAERILLLPSHSPPFLKNIKTSQKNI